jgi:hypothetical protein
MRIRSISLLIITIGIAYMALDGWLISWWYVSDYRPLGSSFLTDKSFYTSNTFFIFWAFSIPLGSIITAFGLALYSRLKGARLLIFVIGSLILLLWLAFWSQSFFYSAIYGIGGGIILFSFCVSMWSLVKQKTVCNEAIRNALDLRAIAYIFFLITAWGMCGLLGVPAYGLHPEELIKFDTYNMLLNMGIKVLICFTLGWIFMALSSYYENQSQRKSAAN